MNSAINEASCFGEFKDLLGGQFIQKDYIQLSVAKTARKPGKIARGVTPCLVPIRKTGRVSVGEKVFSETLTFSYFRGNVTI